jgi:leucyl aminopeptidase
MQPISVDFRLGPPTETAADTRVVGLFEGEELGDPVLDALVRSGEARGSLRKVAVAHEEDAPGETRRVIVAGLGKRDEFDAERARVAASAAARRAADLGSGALSWALPGTDGSRTEAADVAGALVEGTVLSLYRFDRFKSKRDENGDGGEDDSDRRVDSLEVSGEADLRTAVARAAVVARAQNAARDLQNLPSNVATPDYLAARADEVADAHGRLSVETFDAEGIRELGMGAFAAVAQGTYEAPRLIILRYEGGGDSERHLALVGKAVTFDTGGISLKPSSSKMHEMKFDMSGGAVVIEAMGAIAELGLPGRVTGIVPATENMPSGRSVKPGDIVTAMNGKTIEVNNTDAEGRLLLADALAYAVDQGADRIVDLATLTGAILVALGSTYAGLFSNDDDWFAQVHAAGDATGELGWRLPLHPEFFELTKGRYADLTNASDQRKAASAYAAEFLRQFVDDRPWVHMDIAGTAWGMTRPYVGNGASGFGVRTLVELVRRVGGG